MPALPIAQTLIALAVVAVLLKWVLPKTVGWLARRTSGSSGAGIRVEATAVVGGAALHVVRVEGRKVLVGITSHTVTALAEWPDGAAEGAEPAFFEVLDQTVASPPARAVVASEPAAQTPRGKPAARPQTQEGVQDALQRLRRIAG
jgi:flagellar biogenesis protein FliO